MFYKQSVDGIRCVILTLDGGLLDLNHLRFNYYKRLCKKYHQTPTNNELLVNIEEFNQDLGNFKTMYCHSPIQNKINNIEFSNKLEEDLYQYVKLKPNIVKEGTEELIEFLKHKKIKIAVFSTHETKRAIQYLQLMNMYQDVDFVIGGDSKCLPLPDASIFSIICRQLDVNIRETLLIAPFPSLVEAGNQLMMNIIYVPDLQPANSKIESSVYNVVHSNLEVMNNILFSKYDDSDIFSPLLGMSEEMDAKTLTEHYHRLLKSYENEPSIIRRIHQIYQLYYEKIYDSVPDVSIDFEAEAKNNGQIQNNMTVNLDTALFESSEKESRLPVDEKVAIQANQLMDTINKQSKIPDPIPQPKEPIQIPRPSEILAEKETVEVPLSKETTVQEELIQTPKPNEMTSTKETDEIPLSKETLVQEEPIQESKQDEITKQEETKVEEKATKKERKLKNKRAKQKQAKKEETVLQKIGLFIFDVIYTMVWGFISVFVGLLAYIPLEDYMNEDGAIPMALNTFANTYVGVVMMFGKIVFNGLNQVIPAIPNYEELIQSNIWLSDLSMEILVFALFNMIIIYVVRGLYRVAEDYER